MKITMHCSNQYRDVTLEQEYDDDVTWRELIEQFNIFLASMGYLAHKYNNFVAEWEEEVLAPRAPANKK